MSANEQLGTQSQVSSALDAGIEQLSDVQAVSFRQYQRYALASDGFVFWVATQTTAVFRGSLHYATDRRQDEDQTIGANHFIFSAESEITQFNVISPAMMWIGSWEVASANPGDQPTVLQVAFSARGGYYVEADVWHYSGFAVYPALSAQIVESAADLPAGPIVSNSIPIWLAQTSYLDANANAVSVPVYPAFLVPENLAPPYIVADVPEDETEVVGSFPIIGPWPGDVLPGSGTSPVHQLTASQLCRDRVTLIFYGFSNQAILQYLAQLIENSASGVAPFGFADSPVIRDARRPQSEISALAQKKTLRFSANYYQGAADAIGRRLILQAALETIAPIGGRAIRAVADMTQDEQRMSASAVVYE